MRYVFISYSRENRDFAQQLAGELAARGIQVWIDDKIDFGEDWWKEIEKAINACAAFIVIMTPDADQSRWVQREVTHADKLQKPLFPLLLKGDNWAIFGRTQYADVRNKALPETFFKRLKEIVHSRETKDVEITQENLHVAPELGSTVAPQKIKQARASKSSDQTLPNLSELLPDPFEWVRIPKGNVTLVIAKMSVLSPYVASTHTVKPFYIAKYPITNEQYQVFLKAPDGYQKIGWWDFSPKAELWKVQNKTSVASAFRGKNLPRTNVNWYEAIAFCRWLSSRVGREITLPTEHQWQLAAEGSEQRQYPWGNEFYQTRCNTAESNYRKPVSVLKYPTGVSPFGVMDMAGNVREWCLNEPSMGQFSLGSGGSRALRGGAFDLTSMYATCTYRDSESPDIRSRRVGFRICLPLQ